MTAVIDASVMLAILFDEPGGKEAFGMIEGGLLSTVNLSEVLTKSMAHNATAEFSEVQVSRLGLELVSFCAADAMEAAKLRPLTRHKGLSLGDRACLALALRRGLPVLTADRHWDGLDIGVDIRLIR